MTLAMSGYLNSLNPSKRYTSSNQPLRQPQTRLENIAKMQYYDFMNWTVEFLDETVQAELDACPVDIQARFERIVRLIQSYGLEKVHEPYVKHLEGRLWEMRMKGKDKIARALYVTVIDRRVVIVRVLIKKTKKTPRREIDLALNRAKEVT